MSDETAVTKFTHNKPVSDPVQRQTDPIGTGTNRIIRQGLNMASTLDAILNSAPDITVRKHRAMMSMFFSAMARGTMAGLRWGTLSLGYALTAAG